MLAGNNEHELHDIPGPPLCLKASSESSLWPFCGGWVHEKFRPNSRVFLLSRPVVFPWIPAFLPFNAPLEAR